MGRITVVGLHHKLQWRDTGSGDLESLLSKLLEREPTVELIAEEANKLPTTVAQRLACRLNKPWKNVDMDEMERQRDGIYEELQSRGSEPLMDDDDGYTQCYLTNADEIREQFWLSKIISYRVDQVLFLCGLLHLGTVAAKFRSRHWTVEEIDVCGCEWYRSKFGTLTIVEKDGRRWCECRPNSKS